MSAEADKAVRPRDSASKVGSHVSKASSLASSLSLAKVKEAQKKADLSTRIAALKEREKIEHEKLQLRLREEALELQTELLASQARSKVIEEEENRSMPTLTPQMPMPPFQIDNSQSARSDESAPGYQNITLKVPSLNPGACVFKPAVETVINNVETLPCSSLYQDKMPAICENVRSGMENAARPVNSCHTFVETDPPTPRSSSSQFSADEALLVAVKELRKPTSDIKRFGGNPLEYRNFRRQFNTRIVANTVDDDERINFLQQYTTGEAYSIVSGYSCLDASVGYPAAFRELDRRYGDVEVIAEAYIKKALDWPLVKSDDPKALDVFSVFLVECKNAVQSIDALQIMEYSENIKRLLQKLPFYLHDKWRNHVFETKEKGRRVTFDQFVTFVSKEARKANDSTYGKIAMSNGKGEKTTQRRDYNKGTYATSVSKDRDTNSPSRPTVNQVVPSNSSEMAKKQSCLHCSKPHSIETCKEFCKLPLNERMNVLKTKGACFGCLKLFHKNRDCKKRSTCDKCNKKHPTLLHDDNFKGGKRVDVSAETNSTVSSACSVERSQEQCYSHTGAGDQECTLAIIPVLVRSRKGGKAVPTYAFLDTGSSISFMSEKLMEQLGVNGKRARIRLDTMGQPHTLSTVIVKDLEICDLEEKNAVAVPQVYTKDNMPVSKRHIPTKDDIRRWSHLNHIDLPQLDSEVGLLIGNSVADAYTPMDVATGPRGAPHATKTLLGWVIWNLVRDHAPVEMSKPVHRTEILALEKYESDQRLEDLVRRTMDMDFPERGVETKVHPSREDCLFFKKVEGSLSFQDGHYYMKLPFRDDELKLPDNRPQATKRLKSLKAKMMRNEKFFEEYKDFMEKILEKGYAEPVPKDAFERDDGRVWYIPHHGVYHPQKPNKIRVVFDCSAKYQGIALNDVLLQGPNLTNDLVGVLLRFRQEPTAVMADIEKMFYQARVPEDDRDCLRFYWWPEGDIAKEPREYRMTVHLFGATSSPACANTALRHTFLDNLDAKDAENSLRRFYVDDYLQSVPNETEAVDKVKLTRDVCNQGGFNLTGWTSNSKQVIQTIPTEFRSKELQKGFEKEDVIPVERALGVIWDPAKDILTYRVNLKDKPETRRGILSLVSSVYDPLGLAAPSVFPAKAILQDLTKQERSWDDHLSETELQRWRQWLEDIEMLHAVEIPRCLKSTQITVSYQLHVFSDASEKGYGIAAYVRSESADGLIQCRLLYGRARVTPLKKITIPRLELTAATLAVKSAAMLTNELEYKFDSVEYWTDSMLVLRYINNTTSRFHTFVANRLTVIHEGSVPEQWHHVDTKRNPADLASRGTRLQDENEMNFWLNGPKFLTKSREEWPKVDVTIKTALTENDPDVRRSATCVASTVGKNEDLIDELFERISSWQKMKKFVGWILQAKRNLKRKLSKDTACTEEPAYLTAKELSEAEKAIIKYTQENHPPTDCGKLDPFKDEDGLIRVGGRLARASIPVETKHPILLPKNTVVAKLIVEDVHKRMGHIGRNALIAKLRERFWIVSASKFVAGLLAKCVVCRRYRAKVGIQKMADLPVQRLIGGDKPFTKTGMDYFGPFIVKRGRSELKRYGVIFSCYAIRAVHIEMATSLETDSCINAIRRFISRRGSVKYMRSDNGSNLVGAEKELRQAISSWNKEKINSILRQEGIQWEFNAPAASHHGGMWERMIRSIRKVLYGLVKEQNIKLDDEGLNTVFCEVESIINGRPLTTLSEEPNETEPLTPNHLLLLQTEEIPAPGLFEKRDLFVRKRWKQIQHLVNVFWKRWHSEYLATLQERQKWQKEYRNLSVDDIVLVADNTPRNQWQMARVVEVLPGRDGLVRSARVQTKTNTLLRPVTKLVTLLEAENP